MDASLDFWEGGGGEARINKKKFVATKAGKSLLKMWAEEMFNDEIDQKSVDQKNPANDNV